MIITVIIIIMMIIGLMMKIYNVACISPNYSWDTTRLSSLRSLCTRGWPGNDHHNNNDSNNNRNNNRNNNDSNNKWPNDEDL